MSRIFLVGDTHGTIDIHKISRFYHIMKNELSKDDYLIILGDDGIIWNENNNKDNYLIKWYNNKPWKTLFVDGNHCNFNKLYKYPEENWNGGKINKISDSIYHLRRGEIYTINNKKFFCFGGARSTDKEFRKEGISWWPQEIPSEEEFNYAISNLEKHNNQVDYILSHCLDSICLKANFPSYETDKVTDYLSQIKYIAKYKHHYCGHYHIDARVDKDTTILYNDIIELED